MLQPSFDQHQGALYQRTLFGNKTGHHAAKRKAHQIG
jgi:hypothetical protein